MRELSPAGPAGSLPSAVESARLIPAPAALKEIPYDHVARFRLTGRPSNRVQDVINVSVDGAFVAVAIGYSFIPGKFTVALNATGNPGTSIDAGIGVVGQFFEPAIEGNVRGVVQELLGCLLARLCGIDFKYSIVDSGAGRELQNLAIHNIAGLGRADGDRPFRPMAKPMLFMPRSTIRIEIEELSSLPIHKGAELFIVLHGYKILGYGTS